MKTRTGVLQEKMNIVEFKRKGNRPQRELPAGSIDHVKDGVNSMMALLSDLRRDAERYKSLGGWATNPGFWIGATHRARALAGSITNPLVRRPLLTSLRAIDKVWKLGLNVHISEHARIGPGFCLIHARNVMVGPCEMGENVLVFHEVTVGTNANSQTLPKIGDNVDIYVGARVLGKVVVGDEVKIGANCVVTNSVPAGSVVVTAAQRVIPPAVVRAFGPTRPAVDETKKAS